MKKLLKYCSANLPTFLGDHLFLRSLYVHQNTVTKANIQTFVFVQAKNIFKEIYPDADFLPRAPDPDEIIIGDEAEESADEVVSDEDIKEEIATEVKEEIVSEEVKGETADSDQFIYP